ncbi:hypothetical protein G7Y89_g5572 [Cudoniella acicularis]|uniref:GST C-terminal domain-containing protein n=1 Tax=Cudoniella acicularis TaxID=354080 RepID=A0A8H4W396_9HELO|nr:hypothetical protein G7Y89_g5572 [Cudoniella acicularis]
MVAPGKPPGSLPIVTLPNGTHIKQSLAILHYFEDICDAGQVGFAENITTIGKSMRGDTAEERARTHEILSLADEATTHFSVACHKGSALFTLLEEGDPKSSRFAMESCVKILKLLDEEYYEGDTRFEDDGGKGEANVTIADVVLFSTLQFARIMYEKDLVEGLPNLKRFYEGFEKRESTKVEEDMYPMDVRTVASHWIPESKGLVGRVVEGVKVARLYLTVCGSLIGRILGLKK